jgi:hypothetical protein
VQEFVDALLGPPERVILDEDVVDIVQTVKAIDNDINFCPLDIELEHVDFHVPRSAFGCVTRLYHRFTRSGASWRSMPVI